MGLMGFIMKDMSLIWVLSFQFSGPVSLSPHCVSSLHLPFLCVGLPFLFLYSYLPYPPLTCYHLLSYILSLHGFNLSRTSMPLEESVSSPQLSELTSFFSPSKTSPPPSPQYQKLILGPCTCKDSPLPLTYSLLTFYFKDLSNFSQVEFDLQSRQFLNLRPSCSHLLSGIIGLHHQAWLQISSTCRSLEAALLMRRKKQRAEPPTPNHTAPVSALSGLQNHG